MLTPPAAPRPAGPQQWLVAYDIAHPRRGGAVYRLMKKHAIPLQHSLYLVQGSREKLQTLLKALQDRIDPRADDVRVYPCTARAEMHLLGPSLLPEGVLLDLPLCRLPAQTPRYTPPADSD